MSHSHLYRFGDAMKFGFLSKIFEGALSIEKTYNECDRALGQLKAYNEKRKQPDFRMSDEEQADLDEVVNTALENATRIVDKEGERNWQAYFGRCTRIWQASIWSLTNMIKFGRRVNVYKTMVKSVNWMPKR